MLETFLNSCKPRRVLRTPTPPTGIIPSNSGRLDQAPLGCSGRGDSYAYHLPQARLIAESGRLAVNEHLARVAPVLLPPAVCECLAAVGRPACKRHPHGICDIQRVRRLLAGAHLVRAPGRIPCLRDVCSLRSEQPVISLDAKSPPVKGLVASPLSIVSTSGKPASGSAGRTSCTDCCWPVFRELSGIGTSVIAWLSNPVIGPTNHSANDLGPRTDGSQPDRARGSALLTNRDSAALRLSSLLRAPLAAEMSGFPQLPCAESKNLRAWAGTTMLLRR